MSDGYSPSKGYFMYRGVVYGVGTKVKLKKHVHLNSFNTLLAKEDRYVFYDGRDNGLHMFHWQDSIDRPKWIQNRQINVLNCDEDIEEIIEPVKVELVSWQQNAVNNMIEGKLPVDIFGGVLIYIVIMLLALIFKDRWMIWTIATGIFGWWMLNQYKV